MSESKPALIRSQKTTLVLATILLLFFFQLITEFVEAIYIFGLLGSSIPPEIGMVLLFLAGLLLYAFGKNIPAQWVKAFAITIVLARAVEIILSTRGRMIVSGIGVAAFLMYAPSLLSQQRKPDAQKRFAQEAGYALSLAIFLSILVRALYSGSDLSSFGIFRFLTLGLAAIALYLILRIKPTNILDHTQDGLASAKMGRVHAYTLGLVSVIITLYFAFTSPNVVARWASVSTFSVFGTLLISWIIFGWWWLKQETISSKLIQWWGLALVMTMLLAILPHQVAFPSTQDVGYPLPAPETTFLQLISLYLMLIFSPVLILAFVSHLDGLMAERPKPSQLAGAFGLAGFYILVMVFAQVFTTVYDYIPVIGPFFRDKYWLVFLVPSLGAILPAFLSSSTKDDVKIFSSTARRERSEWLITTTVISIISLVGLSMLAAHPETLVNEESDTFRVFTYNIQQGYDDPGEYNYDDQIALIQSKSPDILGLQECDTSRIAGGNTDIVKYFADRLNMYAYYGPSPITGTFGVALLSKYPIENARTFFLFSKGEQVAVVEADISIGEKTYKIYVTHLGNSGPIFQIRQMLDLMRGQDNVIAMGDFNFRHYEEQYELATKEYEDSFIITPEKVFPDELDIEDRIDHIFVTPGMRVSYLEYLPKGISDHPALFADFRR